MAMASSTTIFFSARTTSSPRPTTTTSSSHLTSSSSSFSTICFPNSKLRFLSQDLHQTLNRSVVVKAQSKEVSADGSSKDATVPPFTPGVQPSTSKDVKAPTAPSSAPLASSESISEFISQVANLVKLVDSRDIVELQLKQLDCELSIRKKEALPHSPSSTPPMMIHTPPPPVVPQTPMAPAPAPASASASAAPPASSASASQPAAAVSALPALKCPMAGTFYRSPAPGEPPFVKKGDKVQKGQVMCIIEAMKLMNEIEADQSGTVVDILAEDGKPVSVDTPLFIIKP